MTEAKECGFASLATVTLPTTSTGTSFFRSFPSQVWNLISLLTDYFRRRQQFTRYNGTAFSRYL